ncbi:MAG: cation:proton antiporter, partial [Chloroflexi bacterium]|nr:cation:proton antiporter [Chloroflexota bacterium]
MPHLDHTAQALLVFGSLLLLGLLATRVGHRTEVPRVTLLLIMGIVVGPSALDLLPDDRDAWFPIVADLALVMIGFLLGAEFEWHRVKRSGRQLIGITTVQALATAVAVGAGLWIAGIELETALVLAGIAIATAPAATVDVVRQYRARGHFTTLLLRIVAFDDVLALALFGVLLAAAGIVAQTESNSDVIA